jgi:Fe2+ transport system protein FeoA
LGKRVEVSAKAPFSGPLQLKIDAEKEESLGLEVAYNIFVDAVA